MVRLLRIGIKIHPKILWITLDEFDIQVVTENANAEDVAGIDASALVDHFLTRLAGNLNLFSQKALFVIKILFWIVCMVTLL
jgi:hypothetical protein